MDFTKKKELKIGTALLFAFVIWTILIQCVDVQNAGVNGTKIGFASVNTWFHNLTGVHWVLYSITDWLGIVPIVVCLSFGLVGLIQIIKRRSLLKVDKDIIILGVYYIVVILAYLVFEMVPINYRPVLVDGYMEASYPSSTTLLVLSVMPTLNYQIKKRMASKIVCKLVVVASILFSLFMVIGRLISGVHWCTDIIGSVLFSAGLFLLYKQTVESFCNKQ